MMLTTSIQGWNWNRIMHSKYNEEMNAIQTGQVLYNWTFVKEGVNQIYRS